VGRAVLERADGRVLWELADVTSASASANGGNVVLQTSDYEVFVSRLPETPRRVDGGPYLSPALSSDGKFLVAQRLGQGGHILDKTLSAKGIVLINLDTGSDRLVLEGNDLFSPTFASDQRVFFGSGAEDGIASLYLLDLPSMGVARVTNRTKDARETFPSDAPKLVGGKVVYRADDESFRVPEPSGSDFRRPLRFDTTFPEAPPVPPQQFNIGGVRIRRPNTQSNNPQLWNYFDLDKRSGNIMDWNCQNWTYDGHRGTDINQSVGFAVVAPANGKVFQRNDGCPDTKKSGCGTGWGNYVALRHSDGTVSLEAHGKKWTIAETGTTHSCGDKVMESASSGNSNVPHVHHESWADTVWHRFDPFAGSCDADSPSKWTKQNGYQGLPGADCQ
jgi:murein DD-endopeptidase MepM/ murein hydrolase activator NlpD